MTSAIRSRVHSSPTNPLATAPLRRACSTSTSWASDRRGVGPVGPRLVRALLPPAFQAPCQRLAAWRETPSWRATSAAWMPAAKSSAARSRRAWRCWRLRWAWGRRGAVGIGYSWSGGGRVRPHTSITSPQPPIPVKLAVEEAACERIDEIRPSELLAIYVLGRRDRSVMLNQVSVVVESTSFPERLPLSFAVALQLSVYGKQLSKTQGRYFFCCSDRFVGLIA